MMKQLLNSVIAKYRDLSVSLLTMDKSRHFSQPRPIIVNYYYYYYYYYYVLLLLL